MLQVYVVLSRQLVVREYSRDNRENKHYLCWHYHYRPESKCPRNLEMEHSWYNIFYGNLVDLKVRTNRQSLNWYFGLSNGSRLISKNIIIIQFISGSLDLETQSKISRKQTAQSSWVWNLEKLPAAIFLLRTVSPTARNLKYDLSKHAYYFVLCAFLNPTHTRPIINFEIIGHFDRS